MWWPWAKFRPGHVKSLPSLPVTLGASQHGGSLQAAGLGMVSEDPGCMTVSGGKLACGQ